MEKHQADGGEYRDIRDWIAKLPGGALRNEPAFYCVPAAAYEALMEKLEDLELNVLADSRLADGQAPIRVSLDEL